jgi:hypothetical protein
MHVRLQGVWFTTYLQIRHNLTVTSKTALRWDPPDKLKLMTPDELEREYVSLRQQAEAVRSYL